MSKIDFSEAPKGATHYIEKMGSVFWCQYCGDILYMHDYADGWVQTKLWPEDTVYAIAYQPKPYTRDEALRFLVKRLDSWPTDIADAPLCPGWGWELWTCFEHRAVLVSRNHGDVVFVAHSDWKSGRPDFVPFVSIEDEQPATSKQPAPSGKGSLILGMVLADLTNRALEGREKCGEALKANNGRNALWDAYQEALDLAMYLRQAIAEQESK